MIQSHLKYKNIFLVCIFALTLAVPFFYALSVKFYFYQAVVVGLLFAPLVLIPFLQNSRKTLLALLIITISVNPSFAIYRNYLLAYPISITFYLSDLILLSCCVYIAVRKLKSPSEYSGLGYKYSKIFLVFFILQIAFALFSLFFAVNKTIAICELYGMVRILICYLIVPFFIIKKNELRFVAILLIFSVLFQAVLIVFQYIYESQLIRIPGGSQELDIAAVGTLFRPGGTLGHSSHYAVISALVLPLNLVFLQYSARPAGKIFFSLILTVLFIALIITTSRIGLAAGILGVCLQLFLSLKTQKGKRFFFLSLTILIMVFSIGWFSAGQRIIDRIKYDYNSAYLRVPMNKTAFEVIKHHPFGVGLNNYTLVAPAYDYYGIFSYFPFPVHNVYLLNFAELGILGGTCLIGLLATVIFLAFQYAKKAEEEKDGLLLQAAGVGIICSWLEGLVGWSQRASVIHMLYLAILAAIITSCSNKGRSKLSFGCTPCVSSGNRKENIDNILTK